MKRFSIKDLPSKYAEQGYKVTQMTTKDLRRWKEEPGCLDDEETGILYIEKSNAIDRLFIGNGQPDDTDDITMTGISLAIYFDFNEIMVKAHSELSIDYIVEAIDEIVEMQSKNSKIIHLEEPINEDVQETISHTDESNTDTPTYIVTTVTGNVPFSAKDFNSCLEYVKLNEIKRGWISEVVYDKRSDAEPDCKSYSNFDDVSSVGIETLWGDDLATVKFEVNKEYLSNWENVYFKILEIKEFGSIKIVKYKRTSPTSLDPKILLHRSEDYAIVEIDYRGYEHFSTYYYDNQYKDVTCFAERIQDVDEITDLIIDESNYTNEDRKCECMKCEMQSLCMYKDKYQRLDNSLSLCFKLKENQAELRAFIGRHLEDYKAIVENHRSKRNYIENELLLILQKFDDKIISTSYQLRYQEEHLKIKYTDKSTNLRITNTNLEDIKELVHKEILKPKILEAWQSVKDSFLSMQDFYDMYYCYGERESEYRELYSMAIDKYDDTMELLKLYNEDFYNYIDELKSWGNTYDRCIESAIYCIENKCIPKEVV